MEVIGKQDGNTKAMAYRKKAYVWTLAFCYSVPFVLCDLDVR